MWLCCTGRLYGIAEFVVVFTNVTLVTRSLHISTRYLYVPEFERKQNSNGNGAFADNSVGWHLALSNKFLSPTCAPAHGDIATYFFLKNSSIRYQNMCFGDVTFNSIVEKTAPSLKRIFLYRIEIFFQKQSIWRYLHEQAHMLVKGICC